jgi:hypothetical protein
MMLDEPVAGKSVRRPDAEVITFDGEEPARTKPRIHDGRRKTSPGRVQDTRPKTI